jgi:hypothetical protein
MLFSPQVEPKPGGTITPYSNFCTLIPGKKQMLFLAPLFQTPILDGLPVPNRGENSPASSVACHHGLENTNLEVTQ